MKKSLNLAVILGFGLFVFVCRAQLAPGVDELYRLDRLPELKPSVYVGSVSSYDRTGGNDDGFSGKYSVLRKEDGALVLADLQGPGIIYRVWTPTPSDDVLEFLFDGESQPRIAAGFRQMFLGNVPGFPAPLAGFGAGGYYCYVPIPFAKSCVVRLRGPKVQFFQINYALYGAEQKIATYNPAPTASYQESLEKARQLFRSAGEDVSSFAAPPDARARVSEAAVTVKPHATAEVFRATAGGRITGLRLTPTEAIAGKARDLVLRISFDGEAPAVLCPLGDFFGYAWGQPAMQSLLVGTTGSTNYCYLPMPFDRSALIEITSERATPVQVRAEIVHCDVPRQPGEGKFYALWRRENPTKTGEPYTFLETSGRGHLVGVVLQAQGLEPGKTLFFEGDDQTTIDGKLAVHGTGSEDFFNGGWYDVPDRWEKRLSFPLSGCLGYAKHLGRTGGYRFLLGDAYAYRRGLKQTIEHSGEKNNIPTDYCSVTYFYSENRPDTEIALPPLAQRKVQDPAEMIFPVSWQIPIHAWSFDHATLSRKAQKIKGEDVRCLSLTADGSDWFGQHFLSLTCDLPESGRHAVYIEAVKGPAQAKVQLFANENPVAEPVDLYADEPAKSGRLLLGRLDLREGGNNLMLKLVGKNENSAALGLDLVQVICVRDTDGRR